jgi:hypothetical protein
LVKDITEFYFPSNVLSNNNTLMEALAQEDAKPMERRGEDADTGVHVDAGCTGGRILRSSNKINK